MFREGPQCMNGPSYLINAGSDFAMTVAAAMPSADGDFEKAEGFVLLIGDTFTIVSRQFLMRRQDQYSLTYLIRSDVIGNLYFFQFQPLIQISAVNVDLR